MSLRTEGTIVLPRGECRLGLLALLGRFVRLQDDRMQPRNAVSETHISTLFFTPDRVFKMLKPITNSFLDHRSTEARCLAVDREIELNRRICPDVYIGSADVIEDGDLVDRMLVMKRLPADRSVTALAEAGELTEDHVRSIARAMAVFHASLPAEQHPGDVATAHRSRWDNNVAEMAEFVGPVLDPIDVARVTDLYSSWLDSHFELLGERVAEGYLRDGHGDLLADDVFCTDDGPKILDCLAFRDDFRLVDVLDDIAFLAMDLHRLAGRALLSFSWATTESSRASTIRARWRTTTSPTGRTYGARSRACALLAGSLRLVRWHVCITGCV